MAHKLIKDMNDDTWRKFIGYCKIKNVKVSDELDRILKSHIQKNLNKLFEK